MRTLWTSYGPLGALIAVMVSLVFSSGFYTATKILRGEPSPIVVERLPIHETNSTLKSESAQGGREDNPTGERVVASVNGTKYHYPWCPGASQIKEQNKIVFESVIEAQAAGFVLAGNCKP